MDCLTSRILQNQFSAANIRSASLSGLIMFANNIKIECLICQNPSKILEHDVISTLSTQTLKIFVLKVQKNLSKINECI